MSKIVSVRVVTRAKRPHVRQSEEGYKVYLSSPPVDGKANRQLIDAISDYLGIKRSCVRIIKGEKSKDKLIEIV